MKTFDALLAACLALAPVALPASSAAPPVLWCCQARDKAAPGPLAPQEPPVRAAALPIAAAVRRRRTPRQGARPAERTTHFLVEGMRCAACMQSIETALAAVPGVLSVRASFSGQRATVRWDEAACDEAALVAAFAELGFAARAYDPGLAEAPARALADGWLLRLGVAGFGALATMFLAEPLYYASAPTGADLVYGQLLRVLGALVGTLTGAYAGLPFWRGAVAGVRQRSLGMDALVTMGALVTWAASVAGVLTRGPVYFDALLMLLFLLIAGRFAEAALRRRAYGAMERLLGGRAGSCRVQREGGLVAVAIEALVVGDRVELAPGEQAPGDGVVERGSSHFDEAMLTGEPRPMRKEPGDEVLGGTVNLEGAVCLRLTRVGADAASERLQALVKEAAAGKSRLQSLADRAGSLGTLAVAGVAALTALGWALVEPARALPAAVAVLVVTCPCALGLATPAARAFALARALAGGVLIKRGDTLEALAGVRHVVFDKTGTLTTGEPGVAALLGGLPALRVAAALEAGSEHPLARAIVAHAAAAGLSPAEPPADFKAVPGHGVQGTLEGRLARVGRGDWLALAGLVLPEAWALEALRLQEQGASIAWVALGEEVLGLVALEDRLRPEAVAVVAELRALGLTTTMLSGDALPVALEVAARLGIREVVAEATPADKLAAIARLEAEHGRVLMVGDGLNDAPALAAAGVGLAMPRPGMDLALLAAGGVLLGGLPALPGALRLSRRMVRVIRANFRLAAAYNAVAIPLAVAGALTPLVAALLMPASSLAVLASAMRLLREERP